MLANVSNMCRVLELKPIINEIKRNHDKQIDDEKTNKRKHISPLTLHGFMIRNF